MFQEIPRWKYNQDTPSVSAHMMSCDVMRANVESLAGRDKVELLPLKNMDHAHPNRKD